MESDFDWFGDIFDLFLHFGVNSGCPHGRKLLEPSRLDETDRSAPSGRFVDFFLRPKSIWVF